MYGMGMARSTGRWLTLSRLHSPSNSGWNLHKFSSVHSHITRLSPLYINPHHKRRLPFFSYIEPRATCVQYRRFSLFRTSIVAQGYAGPRASSFFVSHIPCLPQLRVCLTATAYERRHCSWSCWWFSLPPRLLYLRNGVNCWVDPVAIIGLVVRAKKTPMAPMICYNVRTHGQVPNASELGGTAIAIIITDVLGKAWRMPWDCLENWRWAARCLCHLTSLTNGLPMSTSVYDPAKEVREGDRVVLSFHSSLFRRGW